MSFTPIWVDFLNVLFDDHQGYYEKVFHKCRNKYSIRYKSVKENNSHAININKVIQSDEILFYLHTEYINEICSNYYNMYVPTYHDILLKVYSSVKTFKIPWRF